MNPVWELLILNSPHAAIPLYGLRKIFLIPRLMPSSSLDQTGDGIFVHDSFLVLLPPSVKSKQSPQHLVLRHSHYSLSSR